MDSLLGKKVRDKVTKTTGIATLRGEEMGGVICYIVTPEQTEKQRETGECPSGVWFDESRLEAVEA